MSSAPCHLAPARVCWALVFGKSRRVVMMRRGPDTTEASEGW